VQAICPRLTDRLAPAKRILHLPALYALQSGQQPDAARAGLVIGGIDELVAARGVGYGFDRDQGGCGAGREDFGEGGEFGVEDLWWWEGVG
jgi:hypothetical protein